MAIQSVYLPPIAADDYTGLEGWIDESLRAEEIKENRDKKEYWQCNQQDIDPSGAKRMDGCVAPDGHSEVIIHRESSD